MSQAPPVPIITLTVEGMKLALKAALQQRTVEVDEYVQKALDEVCTPENLQSIITANAQTEITRAIGQEVQAFFQYSGYGREAIKEAVLEHLASIDTRYGRGDEVPPSDLVCVLKSPLHLKFKEYNDGHDITEFKFIPDMGILSVLKPLLDLAIDMNGEHAVQALLTQRIYAMRQTKKVKRK